MQGGLLTGSPRPSSRQLAAQALTPIIHNRLRYYTRHACLPAKLGKKVAEMGEAQALGVLSAKNAMHANARGSKHRHFVARYTFLFLFARSRCNTPARPSAELSPIASSIWRAECR